MTTYYPTEKQIENRKKEERLVQIASHVTSLALSVINENLGDGHNCPKQVGYYHYNLNKIYLVKACLQLAEEIIDVGDLKD